MNKKYLLFDLDGTLTDPVVGITTAVQYALHDYGIEVENLQELCCFIGPPLRDSFMKYYNFSYEQAGEAIQKYREYYSDRGWSENKVYPGIEDMLASMKKAGYHLMVATSKPELFAKRILSHFSLDTYFDFIGGADMEETRVRKGDVIGYVLESRKITDSSQVIMIGDREHDILGAKEQGLESVGVLYGYGSLEELKAAGADYIVATVEELKRLF